MELPKNKFDHYKNEKLFKYKEFFPGTLILLITLGYFKPLNLYTFYKEDVIFYRV